MNWMTVTGFALIVGGLATLVGFRKVLWSGHLEGRHAPWRRTQVPVLPAQGSAPEISGAHLTSPADDNEQPTGDHDGAEESEATAVAPAWPPARPFDRIELPRPGPEKPRRWDHAIRHVVNRYPRHRAGDVAGRHWDLLDRDGRDGWRRGYGSGGEYRPQPRPNPGVYVSRHAAEEQR
jgi:hypothetical protein